MEICSCLFVVKIRSDSCISVLMSIASTVRNIYYIGFLYVCFLLYFVSKVSAFNACLVSVMYYSSLFYNKKYKTPIELLGICGFSQGDINVITQFLAGRFAKRFLKIRTNLYCSSRSISVHYNKVDTFVCL